MRKAILVFTFSFSVITSFSQTFSDYASQRRMIAMGNMPDVEKNEDAQKKFIRQEWSQGTVTFKNTNTKLILPLIFDVYSNKLYYLEGKQIMEFVPSAIKEFTIPLIRKNDTVHVLYRSFYPPIDRNTEETFYEVLTDGKVQLLKCRAKTIYLRKEPEVPEEQRTAKKELFYALISSDKIVIIEKDQDQLIKQMPEYASTIQSLISSKKIKLKNEDSLKQLFILLNR